MDIRKILDIVTEAEKPLSKGLKVLSLAQFLQQSGVEPPEGEDVTEGKELSVQELATISDEALDKAYGYGRSSPGNTFGWQANLMSAQYAKKLIDSGVTDIEKISDAIHKGWNVTAQKFVQDPDQFSDTEKLRQAGKLDAKLQQRAKLMKIDYAQLDNDEQEKDRVVARALLKAIKGTELDEAEKLGGVSARTLPKDELIGYLDRIISKSKEKTDKYKLPYIHSSNIPIVNQDGEKYDLQKLAATFSERPKKILKQNEKMQHSDGTTSQFYNVGLPALKGLAVDEDTGEFVVIDTCPGAGQCKLVCYAMKGGYIQYPASNLSQTRLLNFLYNDPDGFMGMLESEISAFEAKNKKKDIKTIIRWHDAGDFFSPQYLDKAYNLAKKFPDVDFYAYTKLASVAQGEKPDNFKINFSMGALPSQEKKIDFQKTKNSRIVPKELFADALEKDESGKWQYKNPQAEQAVKDRMAIKYSLDPKSVITYDEMMKIPVDKSPEAKGKWNVIVKPGDGDDSANRNDVLSTLLLQH